MASGEALSYDPRLPDFDKDSLPLSKKWLHDPAVLCEDLTSFRVDNIKDIHNYKYIYEASQDFRVTNKLKIFDNEYHISNLANL